MQVRRDRCRSQACSSRQRKSACLPSRVSAHCSVAIFSRLSASWALLKVADDI